MAHEVFLCHSARDKQIADAACAALEARRISCWIAPRDVLAGEEWGKSIIEALSSANIVVLIFSGHANESPQVRREIERAVSKAKIIVPFRIENVLPSDAMEYALGNTHWLDAMSPPMEQCLTNLCQTISRLIERQHPLQPPLQPLWKPGDAVVSAEPPPLNRAVERPVPQAVEVPESPEWHTGGAGSEVPRKQVVSGEKVVSQPVIAAKPPAPPAPAPPAPSRPFVPPMPAPPKVPEVAAGTGAGSKAWVWVSGVAVIAVLAILAFVLPRLRKTETPVSQPAASASVASAPAPAPPPQPVPVIAAPPAPEAKVDQPSPKLNSPAPASPRIAAPPLARAPPPSRFGLVTRLQMEEDECAAGTARGCLLAGHMFEQGVEGATRDDRQAKTFYLKACDLGEARGCSNLALAYERSQSFAEAVVFYRKGCDLGDPNGCTNLGFMYEKGQGVSQNYAQAAMAYRKGCNGGIMRGCSNLASLYFDGRGVAKDRSQARNLYSQACSGEYEPACGYMKANFP